MLNFDGAFSWFNQAVYWADQLTDPVTPVQFSGNPASPDTITFIAPGTIPPGEGLPGVFFSTPIFGFITTSPPHVVTGQYASGPLGQLPPFPIVIPKPPTAEITVNLGPPPSGRSPQLSAGDNLSFNNLGCAVDELGARSCSNGWFWQIEAAGTVSDDASKWTVKQTANSWSYSVTRTDGTILSTGSSTPTDDTPYANHTQQSVGTKSVFWLDAPGVPIQAAVANITFDGNFTSKICSNASPGNCACVDWDIHLIGIEDSSGNRTVDTTDSSSSVTKGSYSCSP